jgi:hypothetical protein
MTQVASLVTIGLDVLCPYYQVLCDSILRKAVSALTKICVYDHRLVFRALVKEHSEAPPGHASQD